MRYTVKSRRFQKKTRSFSRKKCKRKSEPIDFFFLFEEFFEMKKTLRLHTPLSSEPPESDFNGVFFINPCYITIYHETIFGTLLDKNAEKVGFVK